MPNRNTVAITPNSDASRSQFSTQLPTGVDSPAAALSSPVDTAQTADFPDLPVLEPAIPIERPITVPPLDTRPPASVQAIAVPPIAASRPPAAITPTPAPTVVEADTTEVTAADMAAETPAELPIVEADAAEVATAESDRPSLERAMVEASRPEGPQPETQVESTFSAEAEIAVVAAPAIDVPAEVVDRPALDRPAVETTRPQEGVASRGTATSVNIPEIDLAASSTPSEATNRWPAPIPFGQPLP